MNALIDGLSRLAGNYRAIICDIWGVVHDGQKPFQPACEALSRFRGSGKPVLLLSNAPRPHGAVRDLLDRLGVPREAYDAILTSGDLTRTSLAARNNLAVYHLGPPRDLPLFHDLAIRLSDAETAETIVCTGPLDDERESVDDYRQRFTVWARHLPLICANPDLVVERGPRLIPCAGALAALYQSLGGAVTYFGKPHGEAYRAAIARLAALAGDETIAPASILTIGDAIATDLKGAAQQGMDALFIAGGIHAAIAGAAHAPDLPALHRAFLEAGVLPRAIMWRLAW